MWRSGGGAAEGITPYSPHQLADSPPPTPTTHSATPDVAETNVEKVTTQRKRMGKKNSSSLVLCCGSYMMMAIMAVVFFVTVMFMRIFHKRVSLATER